MTLDKKKKIKITIVRLLFPIIVLLILVCGAYYGVNEGKWERIDFENRMTNHRAAWSGSTWMSGNYQKDLNTALADQLPFATDAREKYYWFTNGVLYEVQKRIFTFTDYYVHFRKGVYLYGDKEKPYMLYSMSSEETKCKLDTIAWKINDVAKRNPQASFYVYYIEKESDVHLDNNVCWGGYEYLCMRLSLPSKHVNRLKIGSFDDFKRYYYRTDHHWKHAGSYKGYRDIFELLELSSQGEVPVPCGDAVLVSSMHHGSKNWRAASGSKFQEDFYAYDYKFVPMRITYNGNDTIYGHEREYLSCKNMSELYTMKYGGFYGNDEGELIFDTGRDKRPNILIMGDSFDNAMLKILAGHYNKTFSVDLRWYERQKGKAFNMTDYIRKNNIATVLFCGNSGFFTSPDFRNF